MDDRILHENTSRLVPGWRRSHLQPQVFPNAYAHILNTKVMTIAKKRKAHLIQCKCRNALVKNEGDDMTSELWLAIRPPHTTLAAGGYIRGKLIIQRQALRSCLTFRYTVLKNLFHKAQSIPLFVFLKSDPKQNARSLLTPVSDLAFHAFLHGSSFALHGSFFYHFLIGWSYSTANQNRWNRRLLELPCRTNWKVSQDKNLKICIRNWCQKWPCILFEAIFRENKLWQDSNLW